MVHSLAVAQVAAFDYFAVVEVEVVIAVVVAVALVVAGIDFRSLAGQVVDVGVDQTGIVVARSAVVEFVELAQSEVRLEYRGANSQ